jgi:hypothetical protein
VVAARRFDGNPVGGVVSANAFAQLSAGAGKTESNRDMPASHARGDATARKGMRKIQTEQQILRRSCSGIKEEPARCNQSPGGFYIPQTTRTRYTAGKI